MNKVSLGSVSSGTMRQEDLYDAFLGELRYIDNARADEFCGEYQFPETDEGALDEFYQDAVDALFDILGEYAPDYCYFGANEGDGADYGFWVSWDSLEDAVRCGEIDKGDETPDWPHNKPFLHVSDHGDATLYDADGTELWGCV